jgi:hypothetical protein
MSFVGPSEQPEAFRKWNTRKYVPPVPELKGSFPIVLYLPTKDDADALIEAVRDVKPNMKMRHL